MTYLKRAGARAFATAAAVGLLALAAGAQATTVTEGTGILSSYDGPQPAADLDAISASATYGSQSIFLSATMAGAIGTTDKGVYVWGVNRGSGTDLFNNPSRITDTSTRIGAGVAFDAFIFLDNKGNGKVFLLDPGPDPLIFGTPQDLAAGSVTISGSTISVVIPRSFLPDNRGFSVADFGYNIWPRFNDLGSNTRVSDFLPDNSTFTGSAAVPEPATWAIMITGFGLAGATIRRRRTTPAAV